MDRVKRTLAPYLLVLPGGLWQLVQRTRDRYLRFVAGRRGLFVPTLTADPNAIQDIGEAVRGVLQNVNKLVTDNQQALHDSMDNVKVFSKALADNAARIDSIMAGVDGLMGKEGDLALAARSFRELADNLDKRSVGLINDGRRTLADISRAVNNFDRNPTRVLFGAGQKDAAPAPNPNDAKAKQR